MRHSKIDLTMNCYTDPRLLDVSGALDALPTLSLDREPDRSSEHAKATGTEGMDPEKFAPGTAQRVHSESSAVTLAFRSTDESDNEPVDVTSMPVNEKDPLSVADSGSLSRVSNRVRTGDLRNHNPQDSGYKCQSSPEVTATCAAVGSQVGQKSGRDDQSDRDFSAAVLAVMALPLSDSEKAEAVRRLLNSDGR